MNTNPLLTYFLGVKIFEVVDIIVQPLMPLPRSSVSVIDAVIKNALIMHLISYKLELGWV